MKPAPFRYQAPGTVEEAVDMLARPEAKVLAGGQSLLPLLNMRLAFVDELVDINRVAGLEYIKEEDSVVRVGALVRQASFAASPSVSARVPLAARCVPYIGHFVTRNRGTVAGSLAHADSRGELPMALAALNGSVVVQSTLGRREINAGELFITDFTTSIEPDEMIVESVWPVLGEGWGYAFEELAIRHGDYALGMVAVAVLVEQGAVRQARIVAGSVSDRPLLLERTASLLSGMPLDDGVLREVSRTATEDIEPAGDIHASAEYRRHLTGVLVAKAVRRAWEEAVGD